MEYLRHGRAYLQKVLNNNFLQVYPSLWKTTRTKVDKEERERKRKDKERGEGKGESHEHIRSIKMQGVDQSFPRKPTRYPVNEEEKERGRIRRENCA